MSQKPYSAFDSQHDFSEIDHIIIGSGIGGLTTANWLASAGQKVVVLEQHYTPGGFMHSFKRKKGFNWDVGVHYMGNMEKTESLRGFFDFLTEGKVEWESMGEVYDEVHIGDDVYQIKAGKEAFEKQMTAYFPEESEAIKRYLKLVETSNKWASAFLFEKTFKPILRYTIGPFIRSFFSRYSQRTTLEVLQSLTNNKRLIAVLCAQCGNYGLSPNVSSFSAHALVIGHFMQGGYYPKGGADQISLKAIEKLTKLQGRVYINAEVSEILVNKNKVTGVVVNGQTILCKSVISNVGVYNTFTRLLRSSPSPFSEVDFKEVKASTAHVCLYVGLDDSSENLKLPKHNLWCYEHEDIDTTFSNIDLKGAPSQFSYISFPSAKDPEWSSNNPGKATIQAITKGNFEWFEKYQNQPWMKRDEEYKKMKQQFEEEMLERLYQLFPQIKGHVVVTEVSTPLSTKHFSNYHHGEIYGLEHTPARFKLPFLRPETKIKGLRLTGQDTTIVGVAGAMLSGMLTAITILKFRVWKIFKEIRTANY